MSSTRRLTTSLSHDLLNRSSSRPSHRRAGTSATLGWVVENRVTITNATFPTKAVCIKPGVAEDPGYSQSRPVDIRRVPVSGKRGLILNRESTGRTAPTTAGVLAVMRKRQHWSQAVERLRDLAGSRGDGPHRAAEEYGEVYRGRRGASFQSRSVTSHPPLCASEHFTTLRHHGSVCANSRGVAYQTLLVAPLLHRRDPGDGMVAACDLRRRSFLHRRRPPIIF